VAVVTVSLNACAFNTMRCRLGPYLYSAAGRKLNIRMLNNSLFVRRGGGYEDLLAALAKLPAASPAATPAATPAAPTATSSAACVAAAKDEVALADGGCDATEDGAAVSLKSDDAGLAAFSGQECA
jgi:hypothetical protein